MAAKKIIVELNRAFYVNILSNKGNLKNISGGGCEIRRKNTRNLTKMAHFLECLEKLDDFKLFIEKSADFGCGGKIK